MWDICIHYSEHEKTGSETKVHDNDEAEHRNVHDSTMETSMRQVVWSFSTWAHVSIQEQHFGNLWNRDLEQETYSYI